jgi:hypothetical protein
MYPYQTLIPVYQDRSDQPYRAQAAPYATQLGGAGNYGQVYHPMVATASLIASAPPLDPTYPSLEENRYPPMPRQNPPFYLPADIQSRPLPIARQEPRHCLLGSLICRLAKTAFFSLATAFFVAGGTLSGNVAAVMFFVSSPLSAVLPAAVSLTCAYCAVKCGQKALRTLFT